VRMYKKLIALLLAAYFGSYLWLSRHGYAEADQYHIVGFYYFIPDNSHTWWYKNYGCVILFWPLNLVDHSIGLGRHPASAPLWGLSK
jgi:hypothetical protein